MNAGAGIVTCAYIFVSIRAYTHSDTYAQLDMRIYVSALNCMSVSSIIRKCVYVHLQISVVWIESCDHR